MSGFQFRLQTLLDQRTEAKQHAEGVLAEKEKEFANEELTLKSLEDHVRRAEKLYQRKRSQRLRNDVSGGATFEKQSDLLRGLKMDVHAAQSAVLSQQMYVDQAGEAVNQARVVAEERRQAVDVLEKYRQKAEMRFLQEEAYREELEQDEIGNVMHISRRIQG